MHPDPIPERVREVGALRVTWLGHATFLIQGGGWNLLTDPILSERASPVSWAGPRRFRPPPVAVDDLPPIDAVLLSHDHYDHLDRPTVRALGASYAPRWITPLAYREWFRRAGVAGKVVELDWWNELRWGEGGRGSALQVTAVPVQHWSRRGWTPRERLWAGYVVKVGPMRFCFVGDSGYFHGFEEIGRRFGPFDLSLIPIGAYEPRWFMRRAHMNPEEAVQSYLDMGGSGVFAAMHWGTFRLTDEDPLEPPVRTREAWRGRKLPEEDLWIAAHGETRWIRSRAETSLPLDGPWEEME